MFKIVRKKELNSAVTLMEIEAPFVAKKAKAGRSSSSAWMRPVSVSP